MMCEVAQRFAGWLGLGSDIQAALEYVFARWDGRGFPDAAGDAIPLPMRLLHVARDISLFLTAAGPDEARGVIERRAGAAYDPNSPDLALKNFDDMLAGLDDARMWEQAIETEPAPPRLIAGERVDAAFAAFAAITGLKSPWLREHSTSVADLAEAAGWRMGLPAESVTLLRRAALAHDLGRVGVSNAIWEKPGRSGSGSGSACGCTRTTPSAPSRSRRRSRRSGAWPAHTTSGSTAPATTAARAGRRSIRPPASSPQPTATRHARAAAVPAGARHARGGGGAAARGAEGRLDPEAVEAVLDAAGHRVRERPRELPAGLTERELEVLLVLVRGASNQAIADDLGISAKTVGHHVQHVYQKAGVRSRAAATVWAFEHDLVHTA